jgi:hypothetical protein
MSKKPSDFKQRQLSKEEFAILNKDFDGDIQKLTLGKIDKIEMSPESKKNFKKYVKVKNSPDWLFYTPDKKFINKQFNISLIKKEKKKAEVKKTEPKKTKAEKKPPKKTEAEKIKEAKSNENFVKILNIDEDIDKAERVIRKNLKEIEDAIEEADELKKQIDFWKSAITNEKTLKARLSKKVKDGLTSEERLDYITNKDLGLIAVLKEDIKELEKDIEKMYKERKKLQKENIRLREPVKFEKLEQAVPSKKIVKKSLGQIKKPETKKEDPKLVKALKRLETLKNKPKSIIINTLIREQQFIINKLKELKRIKDLGGI